MNNVQVYPAFATPPGGVLYHYTGRATAQEISISGRIVPGRSGLVYLTDVLYRIGWQATDRLALPEKNAEVAIPVPLSVLEGVQYRGIVPEWMDPDGRTRRRGGGHQWVVNRAIRA